MISEEVGRQDENEEQYFRRINIGHIKHAFELLLKYGRGTMLKYCREKSFSADDIDRVEYKFERAYGKTEIKALVNEPYQAGDVPF